MVNDLYDQALFKRFCDGYVDYEYPRDDKKAVDGELSTKENNLIVQAIDKHWNLINDQITLTFRGEKTELKNIGK